MTICIEEKSIFYTGGGVGGQWCSMYAAGPSQSEDYKSVTMRSTVSSLTSVFSLTSSSDLRTLKWNKVSTHTFAFCLVCA